MKKSKGGDATGWKRGERGVDREDNSECFRTYHKKADRRAYGPKAVGMDWEGMNKIAPTALKLRPKAGPIESSKFNAAQKKLHKLLEEQKTKTGRARFTLRA